MSEVKTVVVSVSPQSSASVAASYDLSAQEVRMYSDIVRMYKCLCTWAGCNEISLVHNVFMLISLICKITETANQSTFLFLIHVILWLMVPVST